MVNAQLKFGNLRSWKPTMSGKTNLLNTELLDVTLTQSMKCLFGVLLVFFLQDVHLGSGAGLKLGLLTKEMVGSFDMAEPFANSAARAAAFDGSVS